MLHGLKKVVHELLEAHPHELLEAHQARVRLQYLPPAIFGAHSTCKKVVADYWRRTLSWCASSM